MHTPRLLAIGAFAFGGLVLQAGHSFADPAAGVKGELTVDQVAAALKAGKVHVYDANDSDSYASGHVPTATWIDNDNLDKVKDFGSDKGAELVFYCANPH